MGEAVEGDDDFAISKRIVELHRGRLWCENGVEGAMTVHFAPPADHPNPVAGAVAATGTGSPPPRALARRLE